MKLGGAITAMVTPFKEGKVDLQCLRSLVAWQVESGVSGLVVCGTTGEGPVLSMDEKLSILDCTLEVVKGRVPVIMGATSNNTLEVSNLVKAFNRADAVLIATPYYNKPSQQGIYQHYQAIFEHTGKPVVVYDIPGRTAVGIDLDTMLKIAELPNVCALKDSTGDLCKPVALKDAGISLLSGDDINALPYNVLGGHGCISVTANIWPAKCSLMQDLCMKSDFRLAKAVNEELFALNQAMFYDTNPISVKYALSLFRSDFSPELRLPLVRSKPEVEAAIRSVMDSYFGKVH